MHMFSDPAFAKLIQIVSGHRSRRCSREDVDPDAPDSVGRYRQIIGICWTGCTDEIVEVLMAINICVTTELLAGSDAGEPALKLETSNVRTPFRSALLPYRLLAARWSVRHQQTDGRRQAPGNATVR